MVVAVTYASIYHNYVKDFWLPSIVCSTSRLEAVDRVLTASAATSQQQQDSSAKPRHFKSVNDGVSKTVYQTKQIDEVVHLLRDALGSAGECHIF